MVQYKSITTQLHIHLIRGASHIKIGMLLIFKHHVNEVYGRDKNTLRLHYFTLIQVKVKGTDSQVLT